MVAASMHPPGSASPFDASLTAMFDPFGLAAGWSAWWRCNAQLAELAWTRSLGPEALDALRRERFAAGVRHARAHSALYRDLYRELPADLDSPERLPVVDKPMLMADFDRWVTDPRVTRAAVEAFIADPARIGEPFLGEYAVWRSSGSSGVPGLFVHDAHSLEVTDALVANQLASIGRMQRYLRGLVCGGRSALVVAADGHFASVATARRMQRANPWLPLRILPVSLPLDRLVAELNDYQPAFLSTYPTALTVLAQERAAGRLRIAPAALWTGGECLSDTARAAIESAFGCTVVNEYGASECLSIAYACDAGWLHLNAEWVMLEPVDRERRPVPPGQASYTVLLTNLANRVQPLIRYDLGDSVELLAGRCTCGSPLPALRVDGRRGDVLALQDDAGRTISVLPLALTSAIERVPGVHRFQIVQTGAQSLAVRLHPAPGVARDAAWHAVRDAMHAFLCAQGLPAVRLDFDPVVPEQDATSGKMHEVLARRTPKG
jgi:phenylacetate-coenzyme A ligase PaaK-like adenylate-forming protein